jgi:hypothetical protein
MHILTREFELWMCRSWGWSSGTKDGQLFFTWVLDRTVVKLLLARKQCEMMWLVKKLLICSNTVAITAPLTIPVKGSAFGPLHCIYVLCMNVAINSIVPICTITVQSGMCSLRGFNISTETRPFFSGQEFLQNKGDINP